MGRNYTKEKWSALKESFEDGVPQELKDRYLATYTKDTVQPYGANPVTGNELSYMMRRRAVELAEELAHRGYKVPLGLREVQNPQRYPEAYFYLLQNRHGWTWQNMPSLLDDCAEYWLADGATQQKG